MRSHFSTLVNSRLVRLRRIRARGFTRRLQQAMAVGLLAVLSVGCALSRGIALPPLPVVNVFTLLAKVLLAGSAGQPYGPDMLSTTLTASATGGFLSSCQFISAIVTNPPPAGSFGVPRGLQINVATPAGGATNTGCQLSGMIDPTVQPGIYTFTVRAADNTSPPQTDDETYTINISSLQIALSAAPATTVVGENFNVTWSFTLAPPAGANPNQSARVQLIDVATSAVQATCIAPLTSLGCGPLVGTTAGAKTIQLIYPNPGGPPDPNYPAGGAANRAHTVNPAATTTAITADAPDPSVTGQQIAVTVIVTTTAPGGLQPAGTVAVDDGLGNTCNIALAGGPGANQATGSCNLNAPTAGPRTITANYAGNANYTASSGNAAHTVNAAATTTTITGDAADPSVVGELYTVNVTVDVNAPGAGTPTGVVAIDDGQGQTCNATLAAGPGANQSSGSCTIASTTTAVTQLSAAYPGDANFAASADVDGHTVTPVATTTAITNDTADPSLVGQLYTVDVSVSSNPPGSGQPTGTVAINDGQGQTCNAVLAPGPGANQSTGSCTIASTTTAVTTLTANYPAGANFAASSDTESHTVTLAPTTTTITADAPDPSAVGEAIAVTATVDVNAPGTGTPTGTVAISDGQGQTCNIVLAPGPGANQSSGSCNVTSMTTAVTQLTGNYSGDTNFAASADAEPHVVALATTTTTLISGTNPSTFGQSVTFTATVAVNPPGTGTPAGAVTFVDITTATTLCAAVPLVALSAQCSTTALVAGGHNIQATYSGDLNFASSADLIAQTVNQSATTTTLGSSGNTVFLQPVTFTATVVAVAPGAGTPTGAVNFVDTTGGVSLTGCGAVALNAVGVASCTVNALQAGNHDVQAAYSGDANFTLSASNIITHMVSPNTTTALVSGTNPSVFQETITLTATVAPIAPVTGEPGGLVSFFDITAAAPVPGCAIIGLIPGAPGSNMSTAQCVVSALTVGGHNIRADYGGAAGVFSASSSNIVAQVVNQGTTTTSLNSGLNPSTVGDLVTFTVAVAVNPPSSAAPVAPGGTVTFTDTSTATTLCAAVPLVVGTANCSTTVFSAGAHNVQATYTGDVNFAGSTSNVVVQVVNPAASTTNLVSPSNPSVFQESVNFTATVIGGGPVPTGTITFTDTTTAATLCLNVAMVAGAANCPFATLGLGLHNIQASYSGDGNYAASLSNIVAQIVNQAATTTVVAPSVNPSVFGQSVTFTATITVNAPGSAAPTAPTGTVDFVDTTTSTNLCLAVALGGGGTATCPAAALGVGSHVVRADYSGDANFLASTDTDTQTVNPSPTTTTPVANGNVATVTGEQYTVAVTVMSSGGGAGEPDGSVAIDDGEGNTCNSGALTLGAPGSNQSTGSCLITSQSNGVPGKTITGTFTPGGSGNFAASTGTDAHTVNAAATATVINSKSSDPTVSGEDYTVDVTVTTTAPGLGEPTGNVLIQDDTVSPTDSCTAVLVPGAPGSNTSTGSCTVLDSRSAGQPAKNLTAGYQGDGDFAVSTSAAFPHTVNKAGTGFPITPFKTPDPTVTGETYSVFANVNGSVAGGEGQPSGTVLVVDNQGGTCTITLAPGPGPNEGSGSCLMASTTTAANNLDFTYSGDADFNGVSTSILQTVNVATTTTTITSAVPAVQQLVNIAYTVNFTLTVNAPGAGTPTGTVTVSDGVSSNACALPAASCTLTSTTTGSKNLTATYSGDTDFQTSTSANFPYDIVAMIITTTPAAPGGVMGNGTEDIPIGAGSGPNGILGDGDDGDGVLFQIAGGVAPYTCTLASGALPTGVTVVAAATVTSSAQPACQLSGTPSLVANGVYLFTIQANDSGVLSAVTPAITWAINDQIFNLSPGAPGDAVDGRNYSVMLTASGGLAPLTFDDNGGSLASDIDCASFSLALNGDLTATPAVTGAGDGICDFTSRVLNAATSSTGQGPTGSGSEQQPITVTIQPALTITTTALPNAKKGIEYFPASVGGQPGAVIQSLGGTGLHFFDVTVGPFTLQAGNTWTGNAGSACDGLSFPRDAVQILSPNLQDTLVSGTSVRPAAFNTFSETCTFTVETNDTGSGPAGPDPAPPTQVYNIIAFNAFAFAAGAGTDTVEVVNTETNQFVASIGSLGIAAGGEPDQVAISPDGRYVFVSVVDTDEVVVVDASTGTEVTNSPFDVSADCNGPFGLATTLTAGGTRRVFVGCSVNGGANDERVVTYDFDPAAGGSLTLINSADFTNAAGAGNDVDPQGLAITPDGTTVFVVFTGTTAAGVWGMVDAATGAIIQNAGNDVTVFSPACGTPANIAIAQTAQAGNPVEVYVACEGPNEIAILDVAGLTQAAANISVGSNPNSVAFVPGANSPRAYVSLNGADQIAVIDTAARTAVNLNLPSPNGAVDADSDPLGVTIPEVVGTVEVFTSLSGAAAPSPGVNVINDPATAASVGATIGTTAASAPRGIRHTPVPRL